MKTSLNRMGRILLFPLLFQNGCSQSSRFLPQARRIVGSGDENVLARVCREKRMRQRFTKFIPGSTRCPHNAEEIWNSSIHTNLSRKRSFSLACRRKVNHLVNSLTKLTTNTTLGKMTGICWVLIILGRSVELRPKTFYAFLGWNFHFQIYNTIQYNNLFNHVNV